MSNMLASGLVAFVVGILGIIFRKSIAKFQYEVNASIKNNYFNIKTLQIGYLVLSIIFATIGLLLLLTVCCR